MPKILLFLILSISLLGCGDETGGPLIGDCSTIGDEAGADIQALYDASVRLGTTADQMDAEVLAACNAIASDLGGQTAATAQEACENADNSCLELCGLCRVQ